MDINSNNLEFCIGKSLHKLKIHKRKNNYSCYFLYYRVHYNNMIKSNLPYYYFFGIHLFFNLLYPLF